MTKNRFTFLLVVATLLLSSVANSALAQTTTEDSTKQFVLVTKIDGAEFYGYILSDDGREVLLETKNIGKIYIAKSEIKSITEIEENAVTVGTDGSVDMYPEYRDVGPFTTRYYFTTNAMTVEKGENYALVHLWGPEVHFGVKDKLSVGVMSSWIASPIAVAAKYSFYENNKTSIAVGTILGSSGYLLSAQGFFNLNWITTTVGTSGKNLSISAGYSLTNLGAFFGDDLGPRHDYPHNNGVNGTGNYPIADKGAQNAITQELYGCVGCANGNQFFFNDIQGSAVLGLGGITPVGKKASFIFDAMGFVNHYQEVKYTDRNITVTYDSWNGGTFTDTFVIGEGRVVNNGYNVNIVLMPGMRFQQKYNQAFQVALSGLIHIDPYDSYAFPVPMVSWLRQF